MLGINICQPLSYRFGNSCINLIKVN
jgi:hypothetical protein